MAFYVTKHGGGLSYKHLVFFDWKTVYNWKKKKSKENF